MNIITVFKILFCTARNGGRLKMLVTFKKQRKGGFIMFLRKLLGISVMIAFILMSGGFAMAETKEIKLTSLEWPPYTGEKLSAQGVSVMVAQEAFKAMGYDLKVEFYSWSRAVDMAKTDPNYAGYFPEYYSDDVAKEFIFSEAMGEGPLGFIENAQKPVAWSTLADLKKNTIGVVKDYVNTKEFDELVAKKELNVEAVAADANNLPKVANNRLDLAVIDKNVFEYLIKTDKMGIENKDKLKFQDKLLETKKLFICFKKGPEGEKLSKIFNEGLKKIKVEDIVKKGLQEILK